MSVRAQYFGGVARLWLEAEATERMAVWVTLPNPVPFRKAITGSGFGGRPTLSVVSDVSTPELWGVRIEQTYEIRDAFGALVRRWTGIQRPAYDGTGKKNLVFEDWFMTYPTASYEWEYGMRMDVINFYTNETWFQLSITLVEDTVVTWYAQPTAPAYTEVAAAGSTEQFYICASDGEILGGPSPTVTYTEGSGIDAVYHTEYYYWVSGNPWCVPAYHLRTFANGAPATYEFQQIVPTTTPEDVVAPFLTAGDLPPGFPEPAVTQAWVDARDEAITRRKAWFLKNSADTITALRGGTDLPHSWDYAVKAAAPYSEHVFRQYPMTARYTDAILSSDGQGNEVHQRVVSLMYERLVDGEPVVEQTEITGTVRREVRRHYHPVTGVLYGTSRTESYSLWYVPPYDIGPTLNDIEKRMPHDFLTDASAYYPAPSGIAKGMGMFWSGDMSSIFGWSFYFPDSEFIGEGVNSQFIAPAWFTTNPPVPAYVNTLRAEAPEFVLGFHKNSRPVYRKNDSATSESRAWLSSALVPGMTVEIIPIASVAGEAVLGMFPASVDTMVTTVTHVEVYGSAVYDYAYDTGVFMFREWKPLPNSIGSLRIAIPEGVTLAGNALAIYGGIKWDDVKEDARAQRKALADPNDPAHDPLMKAVLDALTPQE